MSCRWQRQPRARWRERKTNAVSRDWLSAFTADSQAARAGLLAARELDASPTLRSRLVAASRTADAPVQAAVCAIAAAHGDTIEALFVPTWRAHARAEVRSLAWRIAARTGLAASEREHRAALGDSDARVRYEALSAAARTRQPWLITHLTAATKEPSPACLAELRFLSFLSAAQDAQALATKCAAELLGDARFSLLAACGTTPAVEAVLVSMHRGARLQAALAGRAYTRITGVDVSQPERIPVLSEGEEADDFTEHIKACDVARAEASFRTLRSTLGDKRWAGGVDIDSVPPALWPSHIDLETRWGAQLRAAYFGSSAQRAFDAKSFRFEYMPRRCAHAARRCEPGLVLH